MLKYSRWFFYHCESLWSRTSYIFWITEKWFTGMPQTDKMKCSFFQAAVVSILLYGCTTWMLTKRLEKKLEAITQEFCEQYWTSPRSNTPQGTNYTANCLLSRKPIQVRRTRHAGHCWRSKDELMSDVLLWIPAYGQAKAGQPAQTYIQQLCEDTVCSPEDLPEAMNDREKWQERVRDIHASGTTWWWCHRLSKQYSARFDFNLSFS